jgi:hypothetical protein
MGESGNAGKSTPNPSTGTKPTKPSKRELRSKLDALLPAALDSPASAGECIRILVALKQPVPRQLLQAPILASALRASELARSLSRLSTPTITLDLSVPINALGLQFREGDPDDHAGKSVVAITRALSRAFGELRAPESRRAKNERSPTTNEVRRFSPETTQAMAHLGGVLVHIASRSRRARREEALDVAQEWSRLVGMAWHDTKDESTTSAVIGFIARCISELGETDSKVLRQHRAVADILAQIQTWALDRGMQLVEDRSVADLERLRGCVQAVSEIRDALDERLLRILSDPASKPTYSVEQWIVGLSATAGENYSLSANDPAQSASLGYVAAALLAAWDAGQEGPVGKRALNAVEELAESLFNVRVSGSAGEDVAFDPELHEVVNGRCEKGERVTVVKPLVVWSDGPRIKRLVRALVKATDGKAR